MGTSLTQKIKKEFKMNNYKLPDKRMENRQLANAQL